ncbi:uncharacterized protein LOC121984275 [Zingiber officinale]|uniref:Uncharacterized protein n=1 Tax=Zingiber officinale TaxID=94328 RepID=A0A8J5G967_ZINOF|nr:uncharacterized protein LOC121984275 [Zingiber officinale]KAG6503073.1 hypothetical protein ZIOFF_035362 [Zingiber officinale]
MIKKKWEGNPTVHVRKISIRHQSSMLSNGMYSPKGIKIANLQEQEHIETRNLADTSGSGRHSCLSSNPVLSEPHLKPWLSSKAPSSEEEQAKFVPIISQNVDKVDNIQAKRFKSGIVDWGLLERLKYHQKCAVHWGTKRPKSIKNKSSPVLYTFNTYTQHTGRKARPQSERFGSFDHKAKQISVDDEQLDDSKRASTISPFVADSQKHYDACSDLKATCSELSLQMDFGSSVSTSNFLVLTSAGTYNTTEIQDTSLQHPQESQDYPHNQGLADCLCQLRQSNNIQNHLRDIAETRQNSFESYFDDTILMEGKSCKISIGHLVDDKVIDESPRLSNSCLFPCVSLIKASNTLRAETVISTEKSKHQIRNQKQISQNSLQQFLILAAKEERNSSVCQSNVSSKWMKRSASLKEGSSAFELRTADNTKEISSYKVRQSPLRMVFNSLLIPKNTVHLSGPISSSPSQSSFTYKNGTYLISKKTADTSNDESYRKQGFLHNGNHDAKIWKAILQISWKHGVPLFMFSSSDGGVLAATLTWQSGLHKLDFECAYSILCLHEIKKIDALANTGKRSNKQWLVSDVIGRMNVSRTKNHDPQNHYFTREFVLLGTEPTPSQGSDAFSLNSELAAIIVKVPEEMLESCDHSLPRISYFNDSPVSISHEEESSNSDLCNMVILLPSGIHGSSIDSKPPPLIQRWRSGGKCDCGGWDEGCSLTVLSNKFHGCSSSTLSNMGRLELFLQAGSQTNTHAFHMVSSEDGLYTVNFVTSISCVQAFAIGLATLHCWHPSIHSCEPKELLLQEKG